MKTYITAHPIDRKFQEKLGIYESGYVRAQAVGGILHKLIAAGHTEINAFVECTGQTEDKKNLTRLTIHCSRPRG